MKKTSMAKATGTSMHWIIGVVLIVTGALVVTALVSTYSQGQANYVNVNVNINNEPPTVLTGAYDLYSDATGSEASMPGAAPAVVGGSYNVIYNINVLEPNGYDADPVSMKTRLLRTVGLYNVNSDGGNTNTAFWEASSVQTTRLPMTGPVTCELKRVFNDAAEGVNTLGTWRCFTKIYYFSDPTTDGSAVNSGEAYNGEAWRFGTYVNDSHGASELGYMGVSFEYPNILGITSDTYLDFGTTDTSGTASATKSLNVENKGNMVLDIAMEVDDDNDAAAWSCTSGDPLVSDVRYSINTGTEDWNLMKPMNLNAAGPGNTEIGFNLTRTLVTGSEAKTIEQFKFATTQPVGQGKCTLSHIIMTSVQGW